MENQQISNEQVAHTTPLANSLKPTNRFLIIILGCVLLLLITGGSYYLGTQKNKSIQSPFNAQLPSPSTVSISEDSQPKDWKSYSSSSLSIRFKYPREFTVEEVKQDNISTEIDQIMILPSENTSNKPAQREINIWIKDNPKQLSSLEWFMEDRKSDQRLTTPAKYDRTKVNNYEAIINLEPIAFDHRVISNYTFTYKNKAYFISYDDFSELGKQNTYPKTIDEVTFNQVISSLNFK